VSSPRFSSVFAGFRFPQEVIAVERGQRAGDTVVVRWLTAAQLRAGAGN
jgi:hypothetical protein